MLTSSVDLLDQYVGSILLKDFALAKSLRLELISRLERLAELEEYIGQGLKNGAKSEV